MQRHLAQIAEYKTSGEILVLWSHAGGKRSQGLEEFSSQTSQILRRVGSTPPTSNS